MCTILDQEDPLVSAAGGDLLHLEGQVTADVDQHHCSRTVLPYLALQVVEGHAQVIAVAIDENRSPTCTPNRKWNGHEGIRRTENGLTIHRGEVQSCKRTARPTGECNGTETAPVAPGILEALRQLAFGPLL